MPIEEIARLLFNCYAQTVVERGRTFVPDEYLEDEIWKVAEILGTPSHRFGIMLLGNCGNGKTTMLYAIRMMIHHLIQTSSPSVKHLQEKFRTGIPIVSSKDIVKDIIDGVNGYRCPDMLMIDDLGNEPLEVVHYGMIKTPLVDLIETRYSRMQYTIISTNLRRDQIRAIYKNRLADRLNEMIHTVDFLGPSYRNKE